MGWKSAEFGEKAALLQGVAQAEPALKLDPDGSFVDIIDLPFYPKSRLLKLAGPGVPQAPRWYVRLPEETVALHGGLGAIHHCNATAPLALSDHNLHSYVRFRYYFTERSRVFETSLKRSSVGYTGKIWLFDRGVFFEIDVNISTRGGITELEKTQLPEVPKLTEDTFDL